MGCLTHLCLPTTVAYVLYREVFDSPVTLLLAGFGLQYPVRAVFGQGLLGLTFEGSLVRQRVLAPRPGYNAYGFIRGAGVASSLAFLAVYLGTERRIRRWSPEGSDSNAETVARLASAETDGETEERGVTNG